MLRKAERKIYNAVENAKLQYRRMRLSNVHVPITYHANIGKGTAMLKSIRLQLSQYGCSPSFGMRRKSRRRKSKRRKSRRKSRRRKSRRKSRRRKSKRRKSRRRKSKRRKSRRRRRRSR
jgi:hypothetical protein